MLERLQKILSQAGITSRRAAENLIVTGRVTVNGEVVTILGTKADPEHDTISVDGRAIRTTPPRIYIVLNKPAGYVTTLKDPDGRPIVSDLLKSVPERLFPVGRLDFNTDGLLLLTNDGEWANRLAHPSHGVTKEYRVKVRGEINEEILATLSRGVKLDDGWTAPAEVRHLRTIDRNNWLSITIHEGRYRQVRRMCEAVGLLVARLTRIRYGSLELGELKPGEYRYLSLSEAASLAESARPTDGGKKINKKKLHLKNKRDT